MAIEQVSVGTALMLQFFCVIVLAASYFTSRYIFSATLTSNPVLTLLLHTVFEAPVVIGIFSWLRRDHGSCSYWRAVARGLLGIPIGAFLNSFCAIILGAPVLTKYWKATTCWSCLMSLFNFVPATCVFGSSRHNWQRILSHSMPTDVVDYMISAPAHGMIIGGWFGAWPMPLDWERTWQEWPICVTYGAITGYVIGSFASVVLIINHRKHGHVKSI